MRMRGGRRRCPRRIGNIPSVTFFDPAGVPPWAKEVVEVTYSELEALRLVDLEGLTQEEAAHRMGISRRSLWNDLSSARKKVVGALVHGHALQIVSDAFHARMGEPPQDRGDSDA